MTKTPAQQIEQLEKINERYAESAAVLQELQALAYKLAWEGAKINIELGQKANEATALLIEEQSKLLARRKKEIEVFAES